MRNTYHQTCSIGMKQEARHGTIFQVMILPTHDEKISILLAELNLIGSTYLKE
jgi:hypothetical protein